MSLPSTDFHEFSLHGGIDGFDVGVGGLQGYHDILGVGIHETELAFEKGLEDFSTKKPVPISTSIRCGSLSLPST
jgi:hypothetical protein